MGLTTAQAFDFRAGPLDADGASGGPTALATQTTPAFFRGHQMIRWAELTRYSVYTRDLYAVRPLEWFERAYYIVRNNARRARIARGQAVFNSKPIEITGVAGLNDDLNLPSIAGTWGTCHDHAEAGNHSVPAPLDIGCPMSTVL
jgi:cytochrome c peroxidase